ncbi:hypothetical protein MPMin1_gp67 [Microbacterium phage Min1]|uniref:Uncharacterized protein n=1 Tax=Microbacterium phage Min1 TaxID=446529 RepID=A6N229_9CAUD|nr:hypothetical protein MPMin1_gp67 [Microbacterium phage Min1]ABR10497.1 hypothetical protein [Microbacterium phage Min1]
MRTGDQPLVACGGDETGQAFLGGEVDGRRAAAEVVVHGVGPGGAGKLRGRHAEQIDVLALVLPSRGYAARDVVDEAEHAHERSGVDRHVAGLVVERDVPARDRGAQGVAAVGEPVHRLTELPHDLGILRGAEVQAVGDRSGHGAGDRDVAVGLGEGELCARVRVELAVAAVRVGRDREPEARLLIDADHAGVVGEAEGRVAEHVVVVLVRDPRRVGEVGGAHEREELLTQDRGVVRAGEELGTVGLQGVEPGRVGDGALVDRAVDGDRGRVHVDDPLSLPVDDETAVAGDLAEHGGLHLPLAGDGEERVELRRRDDGHHPLLRLRHEDLLGRERGVAEEHVVERDVHSAVAVGGELARGAGDACSPEVLDRLDQLVAVQLQAALDEHLLGEGVADLHRGALGRPRLVEGVGGEDRRAADPVTPRARREEDDLVA